MKTFAIVSLLGVGLTSLFLAGCYAPPSPPLPRVPAVYQPPVYSPPPVYAPPPTERLPKTAVLFVTDETGLTTEQIETRRAEAMRYLHATGYLGDNEVLVNDPGRADRIIRISPTREIGGGYHVQVLTPNVPPPPPENNSGNSSGFESDWSEPRTNVTIIRPAYPSFVDPFYRDPFDPWYLGPSLNFYYGRGYVAPSFPRYYYAPRFPRAYPHYYPAPRHGRSRRSTQPPTDQNSANPAPAPGTREPLNRPPRQQP